MSARRSASARSRLRLMPGGAANASEVTVLSDEALVEAVQRADDRVASEIYDRLYEVVDRTLHRVVGTRGSDHDDLVQQAFEQIILTLSRHSFAHLCSLRTWASRVATHVGLNALRSRRRERAVFDKTQELELDSSGIGSSRDPHGAIHSRLELELVRGLLGEMNPAVVEVLLLHDVFGHDVAEIAMMMGTSMPAAQSRLFRGRRDLRKRLERAGLRAKEASS
jgi:RNA polymerase sigma-70 factor (ECF subfamily)